MADIAPGSIGRFPFIQLTDVFQSYAGLGNRIVTVKGTQDGLETIPQSTVTPTTFLALTDTPASYVGASSKFVKVNPAANALEFVYFPLRSQNTDAILTVNDYTILMDASLGNRTVTLPNASTVTGIIYNIKKTDSSGNFVTITATGGQTIDGNGTFALTVQYQSITIQSDGSNWFII